KTRRGGYDGKGQAVVKDAPEAAAAWGALGEVPCILESFVPFAREVSVVVVRGADGSSGAWPIATNVHEEGTLRRSTVGAKPDAAQAAAEAIATALLDELDYVGVLAIELFDVD